MADLTLFLEAIHRGEPDAAGVLPAQVYAKLRALARAKMAREQPGHTLQPTALVHEAWLRLGNQRFDNRPHFFGAAAEAMRRPLVEAAQRKHAARLDMDEIEIAAPVPDGQLLAVHEALDRLAAHDAEKAELVKQRCFTGLRIEEVAAALSISERTAKRHWTDARAWLLDAMRSA